MSLWSPTSQVEVSRAGWLFVALLASPVLLLLFLWWRVHATPVANLWAVALACGTGVPVSFAVFRRGRRLAALGLHPRQSAPVPMTVRQSIAALLGIVFFVYVWFVGLLFAWLALPHTESSEVTFTVAEVKHCTRKCMGCTVQAKLVGWSGTFGSSVCVEALGTEVQHASRLLVRGRFSSLGVYVQDVRASNAG